MKRTKPETLIGNMVADYRASLGETQGKFAERYDVVLDTVYHWEVGHTKPPLSLLEELIKISYQNGFRDGTAKGK